MFTKNFLKKQHVIKEKKKNLFSIALPLNASINGSN